MRISVEGICLSLFKVSMIVSVQAILADQYRAGSLHCFCQYTGFSKHNIFETLGFRMKHTHETDGMHLGGRRKRDHRSWLIVLLVGIGVTAALFMSVRRQAKSPVGGNQAMAEVPRRYQADRAMRYLQQICQLGPRVTGTREMEQQQRLLEGFFQAQGAAVTFQQFEIRHPETGENVPVSNLVASWFPNRAKRFLLCAHYDTRPFPDSDKRNPKGRFVGANDGGSGVAALMELAHNLRDLPADIGVDIVLFDAEEFVWVQGRDPYFLGSNFFAEQYVSRPPTIGYQAGVLLDMVGDRELKIYYEANSLKYARDVTRGIFETANSLGVDAFVQRSRHRIEDDHIPLNEIARIPTVDLIDFDYPRPGFGAPSYWHTEQDVPANCSGDSLATVVWVVHQWLLEQSEPVKARGN